MNKNKKLETINWLYLNEKGYVLPNNKLSLSILEKKAGVYIYQYILDKSMIYIGSAYDITERIRQHRLSANKGKTCPKFYNYVRKHGWDNFRLGILEYIDVDNLNMGKYEIRRVIFDREQYYLDIMSPTLNILKKAGSNLGFKHTEEMRKIMGLQRRGQSINWSRKNYVISTITKEKLSLRCRNGVIVKVFDDSNNLVNTFQTIASAAKHYDLSNGALSKYIKFGYSIDNLRFEGEVKDVRVWVFDKQLNTIGVFSNAQKAAEFCDTNHTAMRRYLKSGKLWKDKYYFSRTNSIKNSINILWTNR